MLLILIIYQCGLLDTDVVLSVFGWLQIKERTSLMIKAQAKKTNSRWYRVHLWIHRWVSLVVVIPFTILCLTGQVLIFHEEIDHILGYTPKAAHANLTHQRPPSDSLRIAKQSNPDRQVIMVSMDPKDHPNLLLIGMTKKGEGLRQAQWADC